MGLKKGVLETFCVQIWHGFDMSKAPTVRVKMIYALRRKTYVLLFYVNCNVGYVTTFWYPCHFKLLLYLTLEHNLFKNVSKAPSFFDKRKFKRSYMASMIQYGLKNGSCVSDTLLLYRVTRLFWDKVFGYFPGIWCTWSQIFLL